MIEFLVQLVIVMVCWKHDTPPPTPFCPFNGLLSMRYTPNRGRKSKSKVKVN